MSKVNPVIVSFLNTSRKYLSKQLQKKEHYAYLHDCWASKPIRVALRKFNIRLLKSSIKRISA